MDESHFCTRGALQSPDTAWTLASWGGAKGHKMFSQEVERCPVELGLREQCLRHLQDPGEGCLSRMLRGKTAGLWWCLGGWGRKSFLLQPFCVPVSEATFTALPGSRIAFPRSPPMFQGSNIFPTQWLVTLLGLEVKCWTKARTHQYAGSWNRKDGSVVFWDLPKAWFCIMSVYLLEVLQLR